MRGLWIIAILFISINSWAQVIPDGYKTLSNKADSLFREKKFKEAAFTYHAAFRTMGNKGFMNDRYNAACAWAQSGYPDSAIMNLERIANKIGYSEYSQVKQEKYFVPLRHHKKWNTVLDKIKANQDSVFAATAFKDQKLIRRLDSLTITDQKWRRLWGRYNNGEIPKDSISENFITRQWSKADSLNFIATRKIFYDYGFPDYALVGPKGSSDFWLLVQHADRHPDFQDSVLAHMKRAVEKHQASASNYAYLVDRVKVNTGQLQVYGSQMQVNKEGTSFEPKPVIEPEKLNERRQSMGLGTMEEYIKIMHERNYGTLNKK
jgi:hypothetical protein